MHKAGLHSIKRHVLHHDLELVYRSAFVAECLLNFHRGSTSTNVMLPPCADFFKFSDQAKSGPYSRVVQPRNYLRLGILAGDWNTRVFLFSSNWSWDVLCI